MLNSREGSSKKTVFETDLIQNMKIGHVILFGVIYTLVYVYMALGLAGAGHGTFIFFGPLLTWLLLCIALYLLTRLEGTKSRIAFFVLMFIHYAFTLFFMRGFPYELDEGTLKMWNRYPYYMLFAAGWYLIGQVLIWLIFYKALKNRKGS